MTRSTSASPIVRGAPGRGSSSSPSRRPARNRRRHLPTVGSVIKSVAAMALFERPSAAPRMIRARRARAWAVVGRRVQRVSVARSSAVNVSSLRGRPLGMASSRFVRPREMPLLCHTLLTQDTSSIYFLPRRPLTGRLIGRGLMARITRRRFLQGSALAGAAVGATAGQRLLFGELESVIAAHPALAATPIVEDFVPTTCWIGKQDCGILARRIDGRVINLEGQPEHPLNVGTLCPKGMAQITALYDPNRVKTPLIRTNAKGQSGTWRRASWKEALELVAAQIEETRQKDPKLVLWQKGRSKAKSFYDDAFVNSLGATKLGHGTYCSDAGYRALEYTIGLTGVLHPDFRETRYLLSWGWNITNGAGNKFCWITWPRQMLEARERGMKIVQIDPRLRGAGPFADRWLPIRPGTDLALALAFSNVLVAEGYVDGEYLARYTNAATLVKNDGTLVRVDGVPQGWDAAPGAPPPPHP